jgi:hypothetical protein
MIHLFWLMTGLIAGLLLVSVFTPPNRNVPSLPSPDSDEVFKTPHGCVRFKSEEVECMPSASSLNFIASQHK